MARIYGCMFIACATTGLCQHALWLVLLLWQEWLAIQSLQFFDCTSSPLVSVCDRNCLLYTVYSCMFIACAMTGLCQHASWLVLLLWQEWPSVQNPHLHPARTVLDVAVSKSALTNPFNVTGDDANGTAVYWLAYGNCFCVAGGRGHSSGCARGDTPNLFYVIGNDCLGARCARGDCSTCSTGKVCLRSQLKYGWFSRLLCGRWQWPQHKLC